MKTIIKNKTILAVCIGFLSVLIPLLFTACEQEDLFDKDGKTYYFDVVAEGYVYDGDINEPISDCNITVHTNFESRGWLTQHAIYEDYKTDNNGYFRVKFIRRANKENVIGGTVTVTVDKPINNYKSVYFSYDELLKSKKTIQLGTFIYENDHLRIEK